MRFEEGNSEPVFSESLGAIEQPLYNLSDITFQLRRDRFNACADGVIFDPEKAPFWLYHRSKQLIQTITSRIFDRKVVGRNDTDALPWNAERLW